MSVISEVQTNEWEMPFTDQPDKDAKIARLTARVAELEQHNEELSMKVKAENCACSYERPGDVCMVHSPTLQKALARVAELEGALKRVREWGIRGENYSATESVNMADWVDAGMQGSPPPYECPFAIRAAERTALKDTANG